MICFIIEYIKLLIFIYKLLEGFFLFIYLLINYSVVYLFLLMKMKI